MRLCLVFVIASALFFIANSIDFQYEVRLNEEICFADSILRDKLVVVSIIASSPLLKLTVKRGRSKNEPLMVLSNQTTFKHSFTTQRTGEYRFCLHNYGNSVPISANFKLLIGFEAKDYSDLASKDKLKPMENELKKLEDRYKEITMQHENLIDHDENKLHNVQAISNRIIYSSVITIICVLALAAIQSYFIKDFFREKKLI